jgi:hypothetical protein
MVPGTWPCNCLTEESENIYVKGIQIKSNLVAITYKIGQSGTKFRG